MSQQQEAPIVVIFGSSDMLVHEVRQATSCVYGPALGNPDPWHVACVQEDPWWVNPVSDEALAQAAKLKGSLIDIDATRDWVETREFVAAVRRYLRAIFEQQLAASGFEVTRTWDRQVRLIVLADDFAEVTSYMRRVLIGFFPNARGIGDPSDLSDPLRIGKEWPDGRSLAEIRIEALGFTPRIYNSLRRAGIKTVAELIQQTPLSLCAIPGIHHKTVAVISDTLEDFNLKLREDD